MTDFVAINDVSVAKIHALGKGVIFYLQPGVLGLSNGQPPFFIKLGADGSATMATIDLNAEPVVTAPQDWRIEIDPRSAKSFSSAQLPPAGTLAINGDAEVIVVDQVGGSRALMHLDGTPAPIGGISVGFANWQIVRGEPQHRQMLYERKG